MSVSEADPVPADDVERVVKWLELVNEHRAVALIRRQQAEIARLRERLARVEGPEDWPAEVARLHSRLERCEAALREVAQLNWPSPYAVSDRWISVMEQVNAALREQEQPA